MYCVCVRGGGVRSPGEVGVLVHPPLGKCVKALCVIVLMVAQHCTQLGSLALKQKKLPDAVPRDAEVLPLWEDIAVGNWLW